MIFSNEELKNMATELDNVNQGLTQFKNDLRLKENDKKIILKNEKEFIIDSNKNVKRIKKDIKPEISRIIGAEIGRGIYYPYYSEPLYINDQIILYEKAIKDHSSQGRVMNRYLSKEEVVEMEKLIDELNIKYEDSKEELDQYLDYANKIMNLDINCQSTLINLRYRLAINYLEELKQNICGTKTENKKRTLEK